jgi:hypothetical protein
VPYKLISNALCMGDTYYDPSRVVTTDHTGRVIIRIRPYTEHC